MPVSPAPARPCQPCGGTEAALYPTAARATLEWLRHQSTDELVLVARSRDDGVHRRLLSLMGAESDQTWLRAMATVEVARRGALHLITRHEPWETHHA